MTRTVSSAATDRMAAWHSRRASFAMMGEYSSGKSTLLNVLLGQRLLPTKVTATDLPAIWITSGNREKLQALAYDGTLHDLDPGDLTSDAAMDYLVIRVESGSAMVARSDIIDTPGISDPRMSTAIVEEIARYSDFVVWCTPANQAWRQTEKAFWKSIPERLRQHSILALTRADKMRSADDLDKVLRRCTAEAGDLFAGILPISTPLAAAALDAGDSASQDRMWKASGAERLTKRIATSVEAALVACAARPDVPDPGTEARIAPKKAAKPAKKQPKAETQTKLPLLIVETLRGLRNDATDSANNERTMATISHLFIKLREDKELTEDHRTVLYRCLEVKTTFVVNISRVVEQIEHEVADFSEGAWCEIGR